MTDLVNGLLDFFIYIFTIITTPLQNLISANFPSFDNFANSVGSFFNLINSEWIPWIKDLFFLPQWTYDLILAYLIFVFTLTFAVNIIKLILKYWNTLVP